MVFTTIGCLFIILFGIEIGIKAIFLNDGESWVETEPLEGSPVKYNLTGHIIPVTVINEYDELNGISPAKHNLPVPQDLESDAMKRKVIIFMAFLNVAVVIALGRN